MYNKVIHINHHTNQPTTMTTTTSSNYTEPPLWSPDGIEALLVDVNIPGNHPLFPTVMASAAAFCGGSSGYSKDDPSYTRGHGIDSVEQLVAHKPNLCNKFIVYLDLPQAKKRLMRVALDAKKLPVNQQNRRGRKSRFADETQITVQHENPHKLGSLIHARHERYKSASTRKEFIALGGTSSDFNNGVDAMRIIICNGLDEEYEDTASISESEC
jgi:hypothetical protein